MAFHAVRSVPRLSAHTFPQTLLFARCKPQPESYHFYGGWNFTYPKPSKGFTKLSSHWQDGVERPSPEGIAVQSPNIQKIVSEKQATTPPTSMTRPLISRFGSLIKEYKEHVTLADIVAFITIGSALLAIGQVIYISFENKKREGNLLSAFDKGAVPKIGEDNLIDRPGISQQVASILQPPHDYNRYDMIVGYQGTGKTTLVRNIGHKYPGVIYVNVVPRYTADESFALTFAEALHWSPYRSNWIETILSIPALTPKSNTRITLLQEVLKDFCRMAKIYKTKHGNCPILIIDNASRLAVKNPELLNDLQDIAKDGADDRLFITLFVSSEGHAPAQLLARSARSRLGQVITVGDINFTEVRDLLSKRDPKYEIYSERVYTLVGGRIQAIDEVIRELNKGTNWADIEANVLDKASCDFDAARILSNGKLQEVPFKIASKILQNGFINKEDFACIVGDYVEEERLLSLNIFAKVPFSKKITFQSKPSAIVGRRMVEAVVAAGGYEASG